MRKEINIALTVALALQQGCSFLPNTQKQVEPTSLQPTLTPFQPETETPSAVTSENPTQTPEATKTPLQEFIFDGYDLGNTPFKLNLPKETAVALGKGDVLSFYEQTPTPILGKDFTDEENKMMENNIQDHKDPKIGNRFISTLIVGMKGAAILMHSYEDTSGGQLPYWAGGIERQNQFGGLKDKPVEMEFVDGRKLTGQIKYVLNIEANLWEKGKNNIDSWDRGIAPIRLRPDLIGIPNEFVNDPDPKALYVLFVACNNEVEGTESWDILGRPIHWLNQAKRTIVVVKFQLP